VRTTGAMRAAVFQPSLDLPEPSLAGEILAMSRAQPHGGLVQNLQI
jgi:hypothetical protein